VLTPRADHSHRQRRADCFETKSVDNLGKYTGDFGYLSGSYSISASDLDDMAFGACGKFEHTHDVDSNSWEFCMVCKSGC